MKRKVSWVFSAIAFIAPSVWAYFSIKTLSKTQVNLGSAGEICGTPYVAIHDLALVAAGVISMLAVTLNILALRGTDTKAALRYVEVIVVASPIIGVAVFIAGLVNA